MVNGTGDSNVEQAHARLLGEGNRVYLILVSDRSTGLEGEIYRDMIRRDIRATAGPDEGFDTHGEFCSPDCVYVPAEDANAITPDSWYDVLRHEYRHVVQSKNNPDMAKDFRDSSGRFTTYAAFSEACADYGLYVAPQYQAQARIDQLKQALGAAGQNLIDRACMGEVPAYQALMAQYDQANGTNGSFALLFPPFE